MPASSFQQQKLRVCEVCSAYLGLHDNDRRLADHFGGKLHLGFIQIREKLDQLKVRPSLSGSYPMASILKFWGSAQKGWRRTDICSLPFCTESCCRQAGEEKPGALKKKRRKGEGGKDEEEVSADIRNSADVIDVSIHCQISVRLFHVEPDHAAESIKG